MRQWVFAAPIEQPFVVWSVEDQVYKTAVFTREAAQRYVDNTNAAILAWRQDAVEAGVSPFLPPVLREHQNQGWRGGSIHGAKVAGSGAKYGIYLDVEWLPSVAADVRSNHTSFVSIGTLATYTDYQGREFSPVINELSITEDPRLKNIGKIQDTMSLRLSEALNYGERKMTEEQIKQLMDQLASISGRLDAIEARQAQIEEKMSEDMDLADGEPKDQALADGEPKAEDKIEDPAVKLGEKIVKDALTYAERKLSGLRLHDIPAQTAPAKALSRREQGIRAGLTGKALADFTLGLQK